MVEYLNWAGFVYCVAGVSGYQCPNSNANSGVTEVIGEWTVPNVASTSSSNEYSSTWIGIGGNNAAGDLVQMGTEEDVTPSGSRTFSTWWEMLPASETVFTLSGGISPGDTIYAELSYGGTDILGLQVWNFLMEDVTTGASGLFSETCFLNCTASTFSSADFIEEATQVNGVISQLPAFTQTNFWNDEIFVGGSAFYLSSNLSGNLINAIIDNPNYVNVAVGIASSLGTGEFWANYLVSVGNCFFSQTCYSLSTNSIDYGQTMSTTLQLYSVSSFSSSTATNLGFGMSIRSSGGTLYSDSSHDVYGLSISSGTNAYTRQFSIVSGETAGSYQVALAIWYVPSGGSIGGARSLQIATNGFSSSILTVYNQLSVGLPSISPSTIQMGQSTTLTASASGGSGGYSYSWNGLPSGCQSVNQASFTCTPTSTGQFSISVKVTDSTGVSIVSSSSTLTVIPYSVMTVSYSISGGGTGYVAPFFNYVQGGVSKQYTLTTTATAIQVDQSSGWSVTPNPLTGSTSSERWYSNQVLSGTASATTLVFTFYHQYLQTLSYLVVGGGTSYSAPTFTANRNGVSAPTTLTATATGYWYDSSVSWVVTNPLGGSTGSEQWYSTGAAGGATSAAQTLAFSYQHQYYLTMVANPSVGGTVSPSSGWQNSGATVPISETANDGWQLLDWAGSGSGSCSSPNPCSSVTMNGPITETADFEQVVTQTTTTITTSSTSTLTSSTSTSGTTTTTTTTSTSTSVSGYTCVVSTTTTTSVSILPQIATTTTSATSTSTTTTSTTGTLVTTTFFTSTSTQTILTITTTSACTLSLTSTSTTVTTSTTYPPRTVVFHTTPTTFVGATTPGSISACSGSFTDGQSTVCSPTFSATANPPSPSTGWQFDHWIWSGGVTCTAIGNTASCSSSLSGGSLTAVYAAQVTFQTNPSTAGSISWGSCSNTGETDGETVFDTGYGSVTACANVPLSYTFSGWSCSGGLSCSGSGGFTTVSFTGPGSITATFAENLVTGVDAGWGSVSPNCPSPSGCPEAVGSSVTVTATPAIGWSFFNWSTMIGETCSTASCTFNMPNNPVTLSATFVVANPPQAGSPVGVVRGLDNGVYFNWHSGSSWVSWTELPGATVGSPAGIECGGQLYFAVQGTDNGIWFGSLSISTGAFSGWSSIPGSTPSGPGLTADSSCNLYMAVRGMGNEIWLNKYTSGAWHGWRQLPGSTPDSPSVAVYAGSLWVSVEGTDHRTIWVGQENLGLTSFSGWNALPGATPSGPRLAVDAVNNVLYLAVRGLDNRIYLSQNSGVGWSTWSPIPGGLTVNSPSILINGGLVYVEVQGTDNGIWLITSPSGSSWSSWTKLSGATISGPTLA